MSNEKLELEIQQTSSPSPSYKGWQAAIAQYSQFDDTYKVV